MRNGRALLNVSFKATPGVKPTFHTEYQQGFYSLSATGDVSLTLCGVMVECKL